MRRFSLSAVATFLAAAACQPKASPTTAAAVDTAAAKAGIDSLRNRFMALQTAGDATGVAGLYTQDATLDIYGMPRQRGRAAIEAALKTDYGMRKYTLSQVMPGMTTVRTNEDGSEIGTYHDMHDAAGKKDHEWGRYVVGLHKDADGMWRMTYVMAFPDSTKAEK